MLKQIIQILNFEFTIQQIYFLIQFVVEEVFKDNQFQVNEQQTIFLMIENNFQMQFEDAKKRIFW